MLCVCFCFFRPIHLFFSNCQFLSIYLKSKDGENQAILSDPFNFNIVMHAQMGFSVKSPTYAAINFTPKINAIIRLRVCCAADIKKTFSLLHFLFGFIQLFYVIAFYFFSFALC